jgi:hypothetical protein
MQKPFDEMNMKILNSEERVEFMKEWNKTGQTINKLRAQEESKEYNEPAHYHKHHIDTIKFLQEGFPPEVFMGFALGHIIKYAQRANYKNGREDYVKMVDYAKRALDWYDKTHS